MIGRGLLGIKNDIDVIAPSQRSRCRSDAGLAIQKQNVLIAVCALFSDSLQAIGIRPDRKPLSTVANVPLVVPLLNRAADPSGRILIQVSERSAAPQLVVGASSVFPGRQAKGCSDDHTH